MIKSEKFFVVLINLSLLLFFFGHNFKSWLDLEKFSKKIIKLNSSFKIVQKFRFNFSINLPVTLVLIFYF